MLNSNDIPSQLLLKIVIKIYQIVNTETNYLRLALYISLAG
jgi:hypothetical protein